MFARGADLLEAKAAEVRDRHGVEVRTLSADLADLSVVEAVASVTDDIDVGLVVYNATVAPAGRFADVDLDVHLLSVAVNCATPVALCHHFVPRLTARGRGGIALVSSMGGTQGAINFSTYNAGKAFDWILAESLWAELHPLGVDVTTIFVGPTASPNYLAFQATLDTVAIADLGGLGLEEVGAAGDHHHVQAPCGSLVGQGGADPHRGPGDERPRAVPLCELLGHGSPPIEKAHF